jgi:hypothetical protein
MRNAQVAQDEAGNPPWFLPTVPAAVRTTSIFSAVQIEWSLAQLHRRA